MGSPDPPLSHYLPFDRPFGRLTVLSKADRRCLRLLLPAASYFMLPTVSASRRRASNTFLVFPEILPRYLISVMNADLDGEDGPRWEPVSTVFNEPFARRLFETAQGAIVLAS